MKKKLFKSLIITFLILSGEVTSKEATTKEYLGGLIRVHKGGTRLPSVSSDSFSPTKIDKDNPTFLDALLFESKKDCINRKKELH